MDLRKSHLSRTYMENQIKIYKSLYTNEILAQTTDLYIYISAATLEREEDACLSKLINK